MTEINHDRTVGFQPELELYLNIEPEVPTEAGKFTRRKGMFPLGLETSLDSMWDEFSQSDQAKVSLKPKDGDDPFYIAQLRARELESLENLDGVPVLDEGLPFEQDATQSALIGIQTRDELNRNIPEGVRETRLAFSTFMLTVLKYPSLKQFPLQDDEEMIITGLFKEFDFGTYNQKGTIVVPLIKPWIHTPRHMRGVELVSATIPITSIGSWKWTIPRN